MLKIPVLVSDITHLTDARYFAAYGVDFLSFPIEPHVDRPISVGKLKEIAEWIEGPQILGSLTGIEDIHAIIEQYREAVVGYTLGVFTSSEVLNTMTDKICIKEVLLDENGFNKESLSQVIDHTSYILIKTDLPYGIASQLASVEELDPKTTFIDTSIQVSDLAAAEYGIVLRGSEEEKIGFKSFDELDDILEELSVSI